MSTEATNPDHGRYETTKSGFVRPLLICILLAGFGGLGGFFAGKLDLLNIDFLAPSQPGSTQGTSFVDIEPLTVSVERPDRIAQIRLRLTLEVNSGHARSVEAMMPRINDVLNTYLRAVDPAEFDGPGALVRLRGQMLRRIQIVVGSDAIYDLLIQELVIN